MGKFRFKPEVVEQLRVNKYVANISESSIQFTPEFKAIIISESRLGKSQRQILNEHGIDSEAFGRNRIESLFKRARQQAKRPEGFERKKCPGRPKKRTFSSPEEENRYLRDRNEYLEQENEFLKKLKALERGE